MNIKKIFGKIIKIGSALALLLMLSGQLFSGPKSTEATGPRFNFMAKDHELFRGLNYTADERVYTDPANSNGSDEIVANVYYHNGVVDTTAENTRIKVTMPTITNSKSKVLSASISADNAETVIDTVVNGNIYGQSGLTVNTPETTSTISFIPGSVRWFPGAANGPVALPNNQTGDSIITPSGVNIGAIEGCWQYSGYILFKLKVTTPTPPTPANISIDKLVMNPKNENTFVDQDQAVPGDELTYQVTVSNSGQTDAQNVTVRDQLPSGVTFVSDSVLYYPNGSTTAQALPNGQTGNQITSGGNNIGTVTAGKTTKLTFGVKIAGTGLSDQQELVNTACATFNQTNVCNPAKTIITVVAEGQPNIIRSKSAYNTTQKINASNTTAKPGDVIEYHLITNNTGTKVGTARVSDGIADILEYAEIVNLGGGKLVNQPNAAKDDDKVIIDFGEISIAPNQPVDSGFTVKIKSVLPTNPQNGYHYDWTMYNLYGNSVIVRITPPVIPPVIPPVTPPITPPVVVISQPMTPVMPTQLPQTGTSSSLGVLSAGIFGTLNALYLHQRKRISLMSII